MVTGRRAGLKQRLLGARAWAARAVDGAHLLAFVPALSLGAFWLGGEGALLGVALTMPLILSLARDGRGPVPGGTDPVSGVLAEDGFVPRLEEICRNCDNAGLRTACLVVAPDDTEALIQRLSPADFEAVLRGMADRMQGVLRGGDVIARQGDLGFAIALHPVRHLDLESAIQVATRLQASIATASVIGGAALHVSASIGLTLRHRAPDPSAVGLLAAATRAAQAATRAGPGAIRAHTPAMDPAAPGGADLVRQAAEALENGQIEPWFQPQVSSDTGKVSGVEALARWQHPDHGLLMPADFLPTLIAEGLAARLGEVMLHGALGALRTWDDAGHNVPSVAVNFAQEDLADPRLADRIRWELDRFDLAPGRLTVEILETVVAGAPDDLVARSIDRLAALGCPIDLDDFGTGQASFTALRRFAISRLKIDRSFVTQCDRDPAQQKMVAAILSLAEQLDLDTLAEGVETVGEHALVAQLGCGHAQGFGIARPMPAGDMGDWLSAHAARLSPPPPVRRSGS